MRDLFFILFCAGLLGCSEDESTSNPSGMAGGAAGAAGGGAGAAGTAGSAGAAGAAGEGGASGEAGAAGKAGATINVQGPFMAGIARECAPAGAVLPLGEGAMDSCELVGYPSTLKDDTGTSNNPITRILPAPDNGLFTYSVDGQLRRYRLTSDAPCRFELDTSFNEIGYRTIGKVSYLNGAGFVADGSGNIYIDKEPTLQEIYTGKGERARVCNPSASKLDAPTETGVLLPIPGTSTMLTLRPPWASVGQIGDSACEASKLGLFSPLGSSKQGNYHTSEAVPLADRFVLWARNGSDEAVFSYDYQGHHISTTHLPESVQDPKQDPRRILGWVAGCGYVDIIHGEALSGGIPSMIRVLDGETDGVAQPILKKSELSPEGSFAYVEFLAVTATQDGTRYIALSEGDIFSDYKIFLRRIRGL